MCAKYLEWGGFYRLAKRIEFFDHINNELSHNSYENTKNVWNNKEVHADISDSAMQQMYNNINEIMLFSDEDIVLDIGCGDGRIDSYITCKKLYGLDFIRSKVHDATNRNPSFTYKQHDFLVGIPLSGMGINKVFSYTGLQYSKPEDVKKVLKNSIDVCDGQGRKIIAHIDVSDLDKAFHYYNHFYCVSQNIYTQKITQDIYSDGSYWHDLSDLRNWSQNYLDEKYGIGNAIVYVASSHSWYRSSLIMIIL